MPISVTYAAVRISFLCQFDTHTNQIEMFGDAEVAFECSQGRTHPHLCLSTCSKKCNFGDKLGSIYVISALVASIHMISLLG